MVKLRLAQSASYETVNNRYLFPGREHDLVIFTTCDFPTSWLCRMWDYEIVGIESIVTTERAVADVQYLRRFFLANDKC